MSLCKVISGIVRLLSSEVSCGCVWEWVILHNSAVPTPPLLSDIVF